MGAATYAVRREALEKACEAKDAVDTEIWGYWLDQPQIFNVQTIKARGQLNRPELRLTLDYDEDYRLINNIYSNVPFRNVISLYNVIDYLGRNPQIAKTNQGCVQLDLDEEVKNRITSVYLQRSRRSE